MRFYSRRTGPRHQCQVAGLLSKQACGVEADRIYVCEIIGPHERHQVGEHTMTHSAMGNGYTCDSIPSWDEYWAGQWAPARITVV